MCCKTQIYPRLLVLKDFPPKNIIEEWLAKNGNPEIDKQVELEAKLLAEFEMLEQYKYYIENKYENNN